MENIKKRLVEVEYILKKLDDKYINKIPKEIWDFIDVNKDKEYIFNYDESKSLVDQNLNIGTVSILTYINIEYLLEKEQKKEIMDFIRNDELIVEQEKYKLYNNDDIFKNKKENKHSDVSLIEVKIQKWFDKIFSIFKNMFKKT